jgi:hypothetical protein
MLSTLFVAFSLGATAQQRGGGQRMSPEEQVKQRVETVKKEVKLTEKQEKEVTTLFTDTQKKRAEMFQNRQGGGGNWEANREKFQKLQDEENAAMKKILTEEQNKTYTAFLEKQRKEMEERMRSRGQGQGQGRPGGGGGPR